MPSTPPLSFLPPFFSALRHRRPLPLPRSLSSLPPRGLPRRPARPSPARASARPPAPAPAPRWAVRVLYDGECPLCLREVDFLRRRDAGRGRVDFVDIAAPGYSAARDGGGLDYRTAMGRIHGLLPGGGVVRDVEVFRRVYEALGIGWLYAPTRLWGLRALADALYALWAANRLRLTGRPPLDQLVAQREGRAAAERGGRAGGAEQRRAGGDTRCRVEKY